MILLVCLFIFFIIMMIVISIVGVVYTCQQVHPYYERFLKNKWYPYKRKKYEDFLERAKSFDKEKLLEESTEIERVFKKIESLNNKMKEPEKDKPIITREELELTDLLKQYIDDMIQFEITNHLRQTIVLHEKFDMLKLDTGIKEVSTKVIKGLSPSVFNTDLMYTSDYLMNYITNQTFTMLVTTVTEYNKKIEYGV